METDLFTLLIENVRRFDQVHRLPVRPITVLVGENSSGKTTLLAALVAALYQQELPIPFTFNIPPFELGTFSSIATYKGGSYGRALSFAVGIDTDPDASGTVRSWMCRFIERNGLPFPQEIRTASAAGTMTATVRNNELAATIKSGDKSIEVSTRLPTGASESPSLSDLLFRALFLKRPTDAKVAELLAAPRARDLVAPLRILPEVTALAPVRTKPKRTYDQLNDTPTPEGDHVPIVLARLLESAATGTEAERLRHGLSQFGVASGLFRELKPRPLGDHPGDPFQIMVTTMGRPANLADVGYGVSQALPVAVQCMLAPPKQLVVVQQPEVHLHPRAQAALGSLFVQLFKSEKKVFVVETHSDFVVDRIRQHVKKGDIKPSDVSLVYLEMVGPESNLHRLDLDNEGNIMNAPASYRDFFMTEQLGLYY